jgi:hypothetical protein
MGRPRVFVRVIELPDGSLAQTDGKSKGREVLGLSYHKSSSCYYTINEATGNREWRGTNLQKAVASVESVNVLGKPQTWTPEFWKEKEKEAAKNNSRAASIKELERLAIQMPHAEVRRLIVDGGGSTAPTEETRRKTATIGWALFMTGLLAAVLTAGALWWLAILGTFLALFLNATYVTCKLCNWEWRQ